MLQLQRVLLLIALNGVVSLLTVVTRDLNTFLIIVTTCKEYVALIHKKKKIHAGTFIEVYSKTNIFKKPTLDSRLINPICTNSKCFVHVTKGPLTHVRAKLSSSVDKLCNNY